MRWPGPSIGQRRTGRMAACRCGSTAVMGIGDSHAVLQAGCQREAQAMARAARDQHQPLAIVDQLLVTRDAPEREGDRKSTRLNSSHSQISYAVFCLKKK